MNGRIVLTAGCLLCGVLGSVHAFSVLVEPLEAGFGASRAEVSFTYSLALVMITAMVTLGGRIYHRAAGWVLVALLTILGVAGVLVAGTAGHLAQVWIGYGILFGAANGVGYGFALQLSAQTNPGHEGMAMGMVTAAYAVGATVFPVVFAAALSRGGIDTAMSVTAAALGLVGGLAALLLYRAGANFQIKAEAVGEVRVPWRAVLLLWLGYGTAVTAGLMAIGHAVGIAKDTGLSEDWLVLAPVIVAVCNMVGSFGGGWLVDRIAPRLLLVALPTFSAIALAALALKILPSALIGLGVVGLVYGAVITVYPAVIARRYGVVAGVSVYGRVFTAWAIAGLGGPLLAGGFFDRFGDYSAAMLLAGALSLVSSVIGSRYASGAPNVTVSAVSDPGRPAPHRRTD